ncbi:MAG: PD-(D/E)XK nuclease family protein [Patescibacteria group bacterium UBA2163]
MSQYYKTDRKPDWNYGGPRWRLSRSKIDLFKQCPRCFYIDNKLGTARPPGFPFNLNSAVDALLKKEFDIHRVAQTQHPLCRENNLDVVPYQHPKMDIWRENFKGVEAKHAPTGFTVSGAIDDLWVDANGTVIVVDYKATAKDGEVSLDADWQISYKRQMEIYQWLLRQNGLSVSNTGYFVYANGRTDIDAFDGKLEFDITLLSYTGDDSWVEGVLQEIKETLESEELPPVGEDCDYCPYRTVVGKKLQARYGSAVQKQVAADTASPNTPIKKESKKAPQSGQDSLFT